jgi:membrane-bound metal-dependent hydrolase YbcI (DUF457 family)
MYPLGHMALGYFSARATSSMTKSHYNILFVWFFSVSPDIDLLIPSLYHRGPTHSLIAILGFLIPVLLLKREWLPYVTSFGSHALIGDLVTGTFRTPGSMLLWPFSTNFVNLGVYLRMGSSIEVGLEIILFALMILMLKPHALSFVINAHSRARYRNKYYILRFFSIHVNS